MVSRARIVFLSVLIGLLSPVSSQAQTSTLTVVDSEPLPDDGPGDNMVFSVRRNGTFVVSLAFNRGEVVTHRLERDGNIGEEVGRTYVGPEPRAIAMARNGDYAVVVNSIANEVAVMSVGDDGQFSEVSRAPSGGLNPYDVALAFENIVMVANRDSDQINTFHIDRRGRLTPLDNAPTGTFPHVVSVSRRDGLVAVANQTDRSVSLFELNRRGQLDSLGPPIAMSITGSNPPANMTPRTLSWQGRMLFVALDAPPGQDDVIRTFSVRRNGEFVQHGDTPAGAFLTDIEVKRDTLFAVTVNRNNLADPTDDRDEVRAYRREGTDLVLDAAAQTPGVPPSFKQISARRGRGGIWHVLVTEFQGGWLRSLIYAPDEP
jgi:hypothetical protein